MSRLPRTVAAVSGALLALSLAACGSESDSGSDEGASAGSSPSAETSSSAPAEEDSGDPAGADAGACEYVADGTEPAKPNDPPPSEPTVSGQVAATITLGGSEVPITLDAEGAPCTVNSFVSLAEQGYYDDTECHRVTTEGIFVLQCGDPTATGSGGPGYSFADEVTGAEQYGRGTLAMANAGPDTNGSQFFIVYEDSSASLAPAYTVFGSIAPDDLGPVDEIAEAGAQGGAPDGPPVGDATIESVVVD
ncbi:peptidylprolyl isomerase [Nocardioides lentus]|uniref:Peptidyl-prolyl cis-trans isomerase n=1 Tax=Nocardioides lentus TaxID=338077 RepID=A0ABP5AAH6_9ACTN